MNNVRFAYGRVGIELAAPDNAIVYESCYPQPSGNAAEMLLAGLQNPMGTPPLADLLRFKKPSNAVIVVSDITRPIPYRDFLPVLVNHLNQAGLPDSAINLLVATGMHRPSTPQERSEMFGDELVKRLQIEDHRAEDEGSLLTLPQRSASGNAVRLNRRFCEASFKIVTGLVEPHFMAGFSGGRKSICPGLSSLDTVCRFHGYEYLSDDRARNANLEANPLHEESLSIARHAGVDFLINTILNKDHQTVDILCGDLEAAHQAAVIKVRQYACPKVGTPADLVITGSGGYPLDATFYQCVKGMVSCLPALKQSGALYSLGECSEGVGGPEYAELLCRFSGRLEEFIDYIRKPGVFIKDQWEIQMQVRAQRKAEAANLHFFSDRLSDAAMAKLSVVPHPVPVTVIQSELNRIMAEAVKSGKSVALFPEGPYCAPVA